MVKMVPFIQEVRAFPAGVWHLPQNERGIQCPDDLLYLVSAILISRKHCMSFSAWKKLFKNQPEARWYCSCPWLPPYRAHDSHGISQGKEWKGDGACGFGHSLPGHPWRGKASGKLSWQLFQKLLEVHALEFPLLGVLNVRPKRQMTHMKNCGFQITDFAYTNWVPVLVLSPHFFFFFSVEQFTES